MKLHKYADHPLGWACQYWGNANPDQHPSTMMARRTILNKWNRASNSYATVPSPNGPYRAIGTLCSGSGGGTAAQRAYWGRCAVWSVPIYELAQKVADGTASGADIDQLRFFCNKVTGYGAYPKE